MCFFHFLLLLLFFTIYVSFIFIFGLSFNSVLFLFIYFTCSNFSALTFF